MGNYRFRLSDMIPNAWFYKLKDMNKPRNKTNNKHSSSSSLSSSASSFLSSSSAAVSEINHAPAITEKPQMSDQRKSYYFTRDLTPIRKGVSLKQSPVEPPRRSSKRRRKSTKINRRPQPPRLVSATMPAGCNCRPSLESAWAKPDPDSFSPPSSLDPDSVLTEYGSDRGRTPEIFSGVVSCSSSPCKCRTENDIVINIIDDDKPFIKLDHLPPIITKKNEPTKIERTSAEFSERNRYGSLSVKLVKENLVTATSPVRPRLSVTSSSPGVRLRTNSPRIASRRVPGRRSMSSNSTSGRSRRSMSESFAVVKSSRDPRRDFWESMVEMIVENNIRASKDLEELLACYLSLNSDEYHDLIVNVFKQIWFDFVHLRLE